METTAHAVAVAPGGRRPPDNHGHLAFEQVFRERGRQVRGELHNGKYRPSLTQRSDALETIVTTDPSLLAEAAALVSKRYLWRGYEMPGFGRDEHPSETLVTLEDGRVVGTLTLGFDAPGGLRADHTFGDKLLAGRAPVRMLVELSRLAVAPHANGHRVLSALFALAYQRGRVAHGATDLVVEVNPRHVATYCRLFGFTTASDARECGRVRAPAVLLWLELRALDQRLAVERDPRNASTSDTGMAPRAATAPSAGLCAPLTA